MNWEQLQTIILYIIVGTALVGATFVFTLLVVSI
jgi:hypothetical protein